jgi:thiol-disulfide isomerase/thioredoxin
MTSRRFAFSVLAWLVLLPAMADAAGLEVRTLDGRTSALGEQIATGSWTLVMAWTTYCGVCREQYPIVSEFHARHHANDASVLGVALDGYAETARVASYRVTHQHNFPSVVAESEAFARGFARAAGEAFTGTPTYLLFDAQRKLRAYLSGPVTLDMLERAIEP